MSGSFKFKGINIITYEDGSRKIYKDGVMLSELETFIPKNSRGNHIDVAETGKITNNHHTSWPIKVEVFGDAIEYINIKDRDSFLIFMSVHGLEFSW